MVCWVTLPFLIILNPKTSLIVSSALKKKKKKVQSPYSFSPIQKGIFISERHLLSCLPVMERFWKVDCGPISLPALLLFFPFIFIN